MPQGATRHRPEPTVVTDDTPRPAKRFRLGHLSTESAGADILMARGSTGASLSSWVFGKTRKSAGPNCDIRLLFVTAESIAQLPCPEPENYPAAPLPHTDSPVAENLPGLQFIQPPAPVCECLPATQSVQVEALAFNEEVIAHIKKGGECVVITSVGHGLCEGEYEEQVVYM